MSSTTEDKVWPQYKREASTNEKISIAGSVFLLATFGSMFLVYETNNLLLSAFIAWICAWVVGVGAHYLHHQYKWRRMWRSLDALDACVSSSDDEDYEDSWIGAHERLLVDFDQEEHDRLLRDDSF